MKIENRPLNEIMPYWTMKREPMQGYKHPTQKPVELIMYGLHTKRFKIYYKTNKRLYGKENV